MFSTNINTDLQHTHRQHLWQRLRQRVLSAQSDPSRLALLAREAETLGLPMPLESGESPLFSPKSPAPDRLTQTLQALSHLRVEH